MTILIIAAVVIVVIVLGVISVLSWYKTASPNEALIITGGGAMRIIPGGGGVALPFVNKHAYLNMSSRQIPIQVRSALTKDGIEINVRAVAMIKIGAELDQIRAAAQRFQGDQDKITNSAIEVLTGSLRGIVAEQSAVNIYQDRQSLTQSVMSVTKSDLEVQGLVLDTLQIQEIDSTSTYYQDIGRAELASKKKEAEIAEARAHQEAQQAANQARLKVSESERDYAIQNATYQQEQEIARAQSDAAGPLARAEQEQRIIERQQAVAVSRAELKERELDTEIRKPADAARYQAEQEAEARKTAAILDAEAQKQAAIRAAEAQAERDIRLGDADKAARVARAEATQREGEAEAAAMAAKGAAEAQAIAQRADALAKMDESGKLQMQLEMLPKLVAAAAAPMGDIDRLTVLSTDGAAALPKAALNNITQLTTLFPQLEGVLGSLGTGQSAPQRNGNHKPAEQSVE